MITRQEAIRRLRETGTLSDGTPRPNTLTREQVNQPIARAIDQLRMSRKTGTPLLAPSEAHGVLP